MDTSSIDSYDIDWTTEDKLDIVSSNSNQEHVADFEPSCSSCSFPSKAINEFLLMGFPIDMVVKAVKENDLNDQEAVVDALLTYSNLENLSKEENILDSPCNDEKDSISLDSFSDEEICENEESTNPSLKKDSTLALLVQMGYQADYALAAIDRCGIDTPVGDLVDMIFAAEMANDKDAPLGELSYKKDFRCDQQKGRKFYRDEEVKLKKQRYLEKQPMDEDDERLRLPKPMIGFGIPNHRPPLTQRRIPDEGKGRPYFYFENVALTPKSVWETISRFLYDILPEFVDSKFISVAARKRGYIHNLPIENRFQLLPIPPMNIHEALPHTKDFWPSWDTRTKLNCILTSHASAKLTDRIKTAIEKSGDEPSPYVKDFVIKECKRWNLIWVGKNNVAPLEPHEIEMIMGFPANHTRGGGITSTDRFTVLGNAFQIDTVAYHLSVLKNMFPAGLNVLSLFSGIGGAEVALHRLGIRLKNVVSVEISEPCRSILQTWWEKTNQQGNLIHFHDIQNITPYQVETWISELGGFDLIIGGSPCNNLSGGNRISRNGLEGEKSSLFFEYYRIVDLVRSLIRN